MTADETLTYRALRHLAQGPVASQRTLAAALGVSVAALAQWRHRGKGPPFVREGNWIRYRRADVEAWVSARAALTGSLCVQEDTSEAARALGRKGGASAQARMSPEERAKHAAMMRAAKAAKGASHG